MNAKKASFTVEDLDKRLCLLNLEDRLAPRLSRPFLGDPIVVNLFEPAGDTAPMVPFGKAAPILRQRGAECVVVDQSADRGGERA
jgi:hypothetical protein